MYKHCSISTCSSRLTAFVLKSFAQANDYIYIDAEVMKNAALFIIGKQNQDGSFNDTGRVYMKQIQVRFNWDPFG